MLICLCLFSAMLSNWLKDWSRVPRLKLPIKKFGFEHFHCRRSILMLRSFVLALKYYRNNKGQLKLTAATIPVGICVILMALSVLLTCCPPAPCERIVSILRSLVGISIFFDSSDSSPPNGYTWTDANVVCRRP